MDTTTVPRYQPKKGVHVPADVKEYVLKRIREGSKTAAEVAKEHGIGKTAIYKWHRKFAFRCVFLYSIGTPWAFLFNG